MGEMDAAYAAQAADIPVVDVAGNKAELIRKIEEVLPKTVDELRTNGFPVFKDTRWQMYTICSSGERFAAYVMHYRLQPHAPTDPVRAIALHVDGTARFLRCDALTTPTAEFVVTDLWDIEEPYVLSSILAFLSVLQKKPKTKPWIVEYRDPVK